MGGGFGDWLEACAPLRTGLVSVAVLEQQHVTPPIADPVSELEPANDQRSPLAYKLDLLATWLFIAAVVVLCCGVIAAVLALSTTVDTFGIVSPQTESQSRLAVAAALFGGGLAGAGIVAGLAGILKSLVRRHDF
jgi:Na+/proline symporter